MPVTNLRERKRELRSKYRKLRNSCPEELKRQLDGKLFEHFISLEEYKNCKTLFCYISMPTECDTRRLIEQALADGKTVAVPKCEKRRGSMSFYKIGSFFDVKPGFCDILEPDESKCAQITDFSGGLCVVPGLCFDYEHYRLGFGGGYYDRFLNSFGGVTAGICYSRFVLPSVPRGAYDCRTGILVTDKYIDRLQRQGMV